MLRSHRCIVVATFGCLIAAASPGGQRGADEQAGAQSGIAGSLQSIASSLKEANEPKREGADCRKGQDDRESDLCAQWKAADAASDSAYWTEWTVWLGLIGLALGAITMGAAIAAAIFARRAAVATEETVAIAREASEGAAEALGIAARNADAAAEQVRVSERTAQRQLRPYVYVDHVEIQRIEGGRDQLLFWIKNYGQTPAIAVQTRAVILFGPYNPDAMPAFDRNLRPAFVTDLPQGERRPVDSSLPDLPEQTPHILAGELGVFLLVDLEYQDSRGEVYTGDELYFCTGQADFLANRFRPRGSNPGH